MPGTNLALNRIKYIFHRLSGKRFLVARSEPYDLEMKFLIRDGSCKDVYYKQGVYGEDYINKWLTSNLDINNDDLIIDIGANVGWYSLVLTRDTKPTILAFEPDKTNFDLLTENIRRNKRTTVKAYNKAVSDKEGTLTLYLYKGYNPGRHSFIRQKNSIGTAEVPIVPLDGFLNKEGFGQRNVKLVKIDIEGYEYTALKAAKQLLSRTEYILTEFSPYLMRDIGQEPFDYINLLQEAGFKLREITETGLHKPDFEKIIAENRQVNLLGSKR
ncbi:FkbM family methyltransferase [Pollutibacter soli]|uniref:FkbM family methyltransferase n=1 Tax=Pollutibacter soli TaxID=3034157 RepID=UPI00301406E8